MKKRRLAILLVAALLMSLLALPAMATTVTPVLLRLTVGDAASEVAQAGCDADFAYKVNNPAENGTYPTAEGNTITITNSDGYYFDWESDWPVTCVLVKAGSNYYNAFFYPGGAYSDTGLYAPINPANGKLFQISHVSFGYNEPNLCYEEETAWAAGERYVKKGNWAMYVPYSGVEKTVNLIADGGDPATAKVIGTATFSAPVNGFVTIDINLTNGAIFYYDLNDPLYDDNLKVMDYAKAPAKTPSPGLFAWKTRVDVGATSGSITVPVNNFYGVHLDVAVPVPFE